MLDFGVFNRALHTAYFFMSNPWRTDAFRKYRKDELMEGLPAWMFLQLHIKVSNCVPRAVHLPRVWKVIYLGLRLGLGTILGVTLSSSIFCDAQD